MPAENAYTCNQRRKLPTPITLKKTHSISDKKKTNVQKTVKSKDDNEKSNTVFVREKTRKQSRSPISKKDNKSIEKAVVIPETVSKVESTLAINSLKIHENPNAKIHENSNAKINENPNVKIHENPNGKIHEIPNLLVHKLSSSTEDIDESEPDWDGIYISQPRFLLQYLVMDSESAEIVSNNLFADKPIPKPEVKNCLFGFGKKSPQITQLEEDIVQHEKTMRGQNEDEDDVENEVINENNNILRDKVKEELTEFKENLIAGQEKTMNIIKDVTENVSRTMNPESIKENIKVARESCDKLCQELKAKMQKTAEESDVNGVKENIKKACDKLAQSSAESLSSAGKCVGDLCDKIAEKQKELQVKMTEALRFKEDDDQKFASYSKVSPPPYGSEDQDTSDLKISSSNLKETIKGINRYIICKDKSSPYDKPSDTCKDLKGLEDVNYVPPTISTTVGVSVGEGKVSSLLTAFKDKIFSFLYDGNASRQSSVSDVSYLTMTTQNSNKDLTNGIEDPND